MVTKEASNLFPERDYLLCLDLPNGMVGSAREKMTRTVFSTEKKVTPCNLLICIGKLPSIDKSDPICYNDSIIITQLVTLML